MLPDITVLTLDISIEVCLTSNNVVTLGSSVDTCDVSTVLLEFMSLHPWTPVLFTDVDFVIIGAKGNLGMITVPGMRVTGSNKN